MKDARDMLTGRQLPDDLKKAKPAKKKVKPWQKRKPK
jgi:hypothetical protein